MQSRDCMVCIVCIVHLQSVSAFVPWRGQEVQLMRQEESSLRKHHLKNSGSHCIWQDDKSSPICPRALVAEIFLRRRILDGCVEAEARASNAASMLGAQLLWCRAANHSLRSYMGMMGLIIASDKLQIAKRMPTDPHGLPDRIYSNNHCGKKRLVSSESSDLGPVFWQKQLLHCQNQRLTQSQAQVVSILGDRDKVSGR